MKFDLNIIKLNIGFKKIFYVTSDQKWCFSWEGKGLVNALKKKHIHVIITSNPRSITNQIIHFGDRYEFFSFSDELIIEFCKQNAVILTWFHGGLNDGEPIVSMLKRLVVLQKYISLIHTSCSITKKGLIEAGIHSNKIIVIPIAIDDHFLNNIKIDPIKSRDNLNIPNEAFVIGSFQKDGNGWGEGFDPKIIKGPDLFLNLIEKIYPKVPNLLVLLTGPARGFVKTGLEKIGVPYIHHYLDNYLDIISYYCAIDLYVITSRIEGGPKSLAESWACRVPIVSTKVGMCTDFIICNYNGILVDIDDIEQLTIETLNMISNRGLRDSCINNGFSDVKRLSWDRISEDYLNMLYLPLME